MIAILSLLTPAAVMVAGSLPASPPPAPTLDPVFTADVLIGESVDVGKTPLGGRSLVRITGGHFEGKDIRGSVLPGGWDWQLRAEGGCTRLHADYMLRTDDGTVINIVNRARICSKSGEPAQPIYSTPEFEAPVGRYGWLNGGAYIASITMGDDPNQPSVHINIYRAH